MAEPEKFDESKQGVEKAFAALIGTLSDTIRTFENSRISNNDLKKVNSALISKLNASLSQIQRERTYAFSSMDWDKLNVGFFGETNAGKSTIIESLRIILNEKTRSALRIKGISPDGLIVGDGRQDFTQDYTEYSMTIKNRPFVLIDVPGIEGKENLFHGKIGEALRKAHIIIYVNGHNKPIDEGTSGKIKQYMGDGVKVIAIQNMRGNAESYEFPEDRKSFITPSVRTVQRNIDIKFRQLLGDKYDRSIPVQGLLAMCAFADFSDKRQDLRRKQKNLYEYFGEDVNGNVRLAREHILQFSNINELLRLIEQKSVNFTREIAHANFFKLEAFSMRALNDFLAIVDAEKGRFSSYKNSLYRFRCANQEESERCSRSFENEALSKVNRILTDFANDTYRLIERSEYAGLEEKFKRLRTTIVNVILKLSQKYSSELQDSVKLRVQRLGNIPGMSNIEYSISSTIPLKLDFDTDSIKYEDDISFGDFARTVTSTAGGAATGAAIGSLFGPLGTLIGGIIGGGAGLGGGIASSASAQTERALTKAKRIIGNLRYTTERQIKNHSADFRKKTEEYVKRINSIIVQKRYEIDEFYRNVEVAEDRLNNVITNIKNHGK